MCVSLLSVSKLSGAAQIWVNMWGGFVCCVRVLWAGFCLYGYISSRGMCACTPLVRSAGHAGWGTLTLFRMYSSMIGNSTLRVVDFVLDAAWAGAPNVFILVRSFFLICLLAPALERSLLDIFRYYRVFQSIFSAPIPLFRKSTAASHSSGPPLSGDMRQPHASGGDQRRRTRSPRRESHHPI